MQLFDPHSNDWLISKYEHYAVLRNRPSLWWSDKYNLYPITKYEDVVFVLSNPDKFSSANGNLINEFPIRIGRTLASNDNPKHDNLKQLIKDAYTKENIDRVSTAVAEKAKLFLEYKQDFNLSEWSLNIASWLSLEIMNIPYDSTVLHTLLLGMLKRSDKSISSNFYTTSEEDSIAFATILRKLISDKQPALGPGVYSEYIKNCDHDTHGLFFFTAAIYPGGTSTAGALEFLIHDLYINKDSRNRVINNPGLIRSAVAESLRYNTSTSRFLRTTASEVEIQNTLIPKGMRIAVCLDSANRDPEQWEDADIFDIDRNTAKTVSFGYGIHICIAQAITRETLIKVLNVFLEYYPEYKVSPSKNEFIYLMTAPGNFDFVTNLYITRP